MIEVNAIENERKSPNYSRVKKFVSEETYSTWFRAGHPRRGDTLISTVGAIGRVAYFREERGCIAQNVIALRPRTGIVVPEFLYYYLTSPNTQRRIASLNIGVAQPSLKVPHLLSLEVSIPPIAAQQRIVELLSPIDQLIENYQRRIEILEEIGRALYLEWFVDFRFPDSNGKPVVPSSVGNIPSGWMVKNLRNFGRVVTGKTPSKTSIALYGSDVPFVKIPDMRGNIYVLGTEDGLSRMGAESQANKTLPIGSLCVSCIGTVGLVSITSEECQTNQQINAVILADETTREFLFFRLRDAKAHLENLGANGATMGNVNKAKFESIEIACPPNDLMRRYHAFASPLFDYILSLSRHTYNLSRARDLLLPRLISGQLDLDVA